MNQLRIAAAYIRVSTDDQTEFSPAAQKKALQKYALDNHMILDDRYIFVDEGISGRKAERRPAFMEMIAHAKRKDHPFDVILVHKFDRFARSREDSVVYKSMLKKECGVRVISITESIDDDKFSIILESMLEAMAEYYSINLAEEVKKGMTEKAHRGEYQSIPPFGYTVINKQLIPVENEAAYVRQMFERFIGGEGLYPIARWLNTMCVRTHRGNAFENRTVEYILRNPVYVGKVRWTPTGRTSRNFRNPDSIIAPSTHQPLVSDEQWEQAQRILDEQKARLPYHARPASDRKHWLAGLLRCASCDGTLIFSAPHYFKCNNYVRGRCKTSQHTDISRLEAAVLAQMEADLHSTHSLSFQTIRISPEPDRIKSLRQQLSAQERRRTRLQEAYLDGAETIEEYRAAKARLAEETEAIKKELSQLEQQSSPSAHESTLRSRLEEVLNVLKDESATIALKHTAARTILSSATYDKSTNSLTLSYHLTM